MQPLEFWQVTVTDGRQRVTRVVIGCEQPARDLLVRAHRAQMDATLRIVNIAPDRSHDEMQRAEALVRLLFDGGQDDAAKHY